MNTTNTNSGGWKDSYMRNTNCPAFLAALPTEWQNVIAACTKYSDNVGGYNNPASNVTSTSDKIWLLSELEVWGVCYGANSAEANYQKQYDYYKNGNSKIKYKYNDTTIACGWLFRSVTINSMTAFRGNAQILIDQSSLYNANDPCGFAPGFKVA